MPRDFSPIIGGRVMHMARKNAERLTRLHSRLHTAIATERGRFVSGESLAHRPTSTLIWLAIRCRASPSP